MQSEEGIHQLGRTKRREDHSSWEDKVKIDLSAKTAIVTGSTAGIGLAIAKSLAFSGANVVVNGRSKIAVDKAIREIGALRPGGLVMGHAGDLGSAEGCAELVSAYPDCSLPPWGDPFGMLVHARSAFHGWR